MAVEAAVRHLLTTMQYRDATQEETDMAATKAYEQAKRSVTYQVSNQFGWVRRIEEGKFQVPMPGTIPESPLRRM